jgi:uncharacterized repeat protein (TIGR01451 family)
LGGAIFVNSGTLLLIQTSFSSNSATGGPNGDNQGTGNAAPGQGKGGALFINSGATAAYLGSAPSFSGDSASDANMNTICHSVVGPSAMDTADICGVLLAASITATAGTSQSTLINTAFAVNLQATVKDAGNLGVPNVNVTFQAPATGPSGTFGTPCNSTTCVVQTNSSGVATAPPFTANSTPGGAYNVMASISGFSANFALTNLPLPSLSVTKAHVGTFTQGQTGEWDITVTNAAGSAATTGTTTVSDTLPTGYTVSSFSGTDPSWSCNGNSTQTATCTSTSAVNVGSSFLVVKITVNVPLNSPVSVSNTGKAYGGGDLTHATLATAATGSDAVSVTQTAGAIIATAGTPQNTKINTAFAMNLQATVRDASNVGVPNVSVTFQAPASDPSGTFGSPCSGTTCVVQTNSSGVATAPTFTANGTLGSYTVTATTGSLTPANFALTNVAVPTLTKTIGTPLGEGVINEGDTVPITFTIANPNSIALTGLTFTDNLPEGFMVQTPNGLSNTCGGTVTAMPSSAVISLTGGTVGAAASCTVIVQVIAVVQGVQTNVSVTLMSNEAGSAASSAVNVFIYPWWLIFFQ